MRSRQSLKETNCIQRDTERYREIQRVLCVCSKKSVKRRFWRAIALIHNLWSTLYIVHTLSNGSPLDVLNGCGQANTGPLAHNKFSKRAIEELSKCFLSTRTSLQENQRDSRSWSRGAAKIFGDFHCSQTNLPTSFKRNKSKFLLEKAVRILSCPRFKHGTF